LLGRVGDEELRNLYRGANMLVQPGVEDFGIAAVESLACGTPVVAVARGGVLDVVADGRHGVLYDDRPPGGPAAAAGATTDPREIPAVLALAAAIDKAVQISWNPLDLRNRAESFAAGHFTDRMRSLVASNEGRALMSRQVSRAHLR
jgi:glycosyltransferase involved in cell wall biosynthesis